MQATTDDIVRVRLRRNFHAFVRHFWRFVSPYPLVDGWYMKALCYHLQCMVIDCDPRVKWATEGSNLLINIPPRPVAHDALVDCLEKGLVPLSEIEINDRVLTHKGRWKRVTGVYSQGKLPVLEIKTRMGRTVQAAADHPFLTPDGWKPLGDIVPDDVIGVVPSPGGAGRNGVSAQEARLLGYLVGDGCCRGTPNITSADDGVSKDIFQCINSVGFNPSLHVYDLTKTGKTLQRIAIKSSDKCAGKIGPVRKWITKHGLWDCSSYTKMVPDAVMRGTDEVVCNFLGAYWSCDGYISTRGAKKDGCERDDLVVQCDSVNEELLKQIQILLTHIGINSRIRKKVAKIKTKKQGDTYTSYSLSLTSQDDCWRFSKMIKMHHAKYKRMTNAYARRFDFDRKIWGDTVESVSDAGEKECMCLMVEDDESFVANGFAVANTGKSKVLSVLFIAWAWAFDPRLRFVTASYSKDFAARDSKETRTLMDTSEYKRLFPHARLKVGQNLASRYYTTAGGYRVTMSAESGTTGEGGDIQIFDDPHDVSDGVSKKNRDYKIYYYKKIFFNRTETPERARRIVCGQRVHAADLSSELIKSEHPKYIHLIFPEEYDPRISKPTPLFTDPRVNEGDLLRPERFGREEVEEAKSASGLGRKTYAAVHQQKPMDDEGSMFQRRWFDNRILTHMPADIRNWIRYWDLACTEEGEANKDPDYTAGVLGGTCREYPFVIGDVVRDRLDQPQVDRFILGTSNLDYARFQRFIPNVLEAVAGFKGVVSHIANDIMRGRPVFPNFIKRGENKMARAICFQAACESGGVHLVQGKYIPEFLEELCTFGGLDEKGNEYSEYTVTHDDMADAAFGCYNRHYAGATANINGAQSGDALKATGQGSLFAPAQRARPGRTLAPNGNRSLYG